MFFYATLTEFLLCWVFWFFGGVAIMVTSGAWAWFENRNISFSHIHSANVTCKQGIKLPINKL